MFRAERWALPERVEQPLNLRSLRGVRWEKLEQRPGLVSRIGPTPGAAQCPRQRKTRLMESRVDRESSLQLPNRTSRVVLRQREKSQVGFDDGITRFELAGGLERARRAGQVVRAAATIREREARVGGRDSSRESLLQVGLGAIASPSLDLGISEPQMGLRIFRVFPQNGFEPPKERLALHFP